MRRKLGGFVFLTLVVVAAACAESVGTPSVEEEGYDASPTRTDAGKKDGTAGDADIVDEDAALPDAAKKDSSVTKDSASDAPTGTDGGTDSSTPDTSTPPDASYDAGPPSTTLVINEIDYDQPGTDNQAEREFVEIFNKSGNTISLSGYELRFTNGSNGTLYRSVALSGSIAAGGYWVIAAPGFDGGTPDMTFTSPDGSGAYIQNGPNDSISIVEASSSTIIDTITYGKTAAAPPVPALVEANVPNAFDSNANTGSMIRDPNGTDTNDSNADWKFTKTLTPGAQNVYTP